MSDEKKEKALVVPRRRLYDREKDAAEQGYTNVRRKDAPLAVETVAQNEKDTNESFADNPLDDPLGLATAKVPGFKQTAFTGPVTQKEKSINAKKKRVEDLLDWESTGKEILTKFTTQKDIPIVSKIFDDNEAEPEAVTLTDRAKKRLAEMEEDDDKADGHVQLMSQKELISLLESYARDLETAWNKGEKVKSLRIVIQSCKMLGAYKVPQMYPSLFVLCSKVLDTFGRLVYERIKTRAETEEKGGKTIQVQVLDENFRPSDVPPEAKEMCRNWFFKIASIRELLPRIYVELCLWPCYRFLYEQSNSGFHTELMRRFVWQIRGIGDPLVGNYARVYYLRKATQVFAEPPITYVQQTWDDFLFTRKQWDNLSKYLETYALSLPEYVHLYSPSVQWILGTLGAQGDEQLFQAVLKQYLDSVKHVMVLNYIIAGFKSEIITKYVDGLIQLIKEGEEGVMPRSECYLSLGLQLTKSPPAEKKRLRILSEVWDVVTTIENPTDYVPVAQVWLEFVVRHCKEREIGILLQDIVQHVTKDKYSPDLESYVQSIISTLVNHLKDFRQLFQFDQFLPLVDLLSPSTKTDLCKGILTQFASQGDRVSDAVLINALLDVCRTVHDSINEYSIEDERRQIAQLITCFIHHVDFGKDFKDQEAQLNFYIDCRRSFNRLDAVIEDVCYGVVKFVTEVVAQTNKTGAAIRSRSKTSPQYLIKAGLTFLHITIPSLQDELRRLRLLLLSSMVAASSGFTAPMAILLRTLVNTLKIVPPVITLPSNVVITTEEPLADFYSTLIGSLIVLPGVGYKSDEEAIARGEQSAKLEVKPFALVDEVLEAIDAHPWEETTPARFGVLTRMLQALMSLHQDRLPYHYATGTASNDELFAGNVEYKEEIVKRANKVLKDLLAIIETLSEKSAIGRLKTHLTELIAVLTRFAEPNEQLLKKLRKLQQ